MKQAVLACAGALVCLWCATTAADTIRVAGSATVVSALVNPHRDRIEKASGQTLQVVGHASGKGLADLVDRNAEIAMISAPIDVAVAAAEVAGRKVDPASLRLHELRSDEVVFAVNAANPVSRLTLAQVGDIHAGKITNWKQVGGKDLPVTVYTTAASGGTSLLVRRVAMGGGEYANGARTMTSLSRVADMVAGDEGGIGALSRTFVKGDGKSRVLDGARIPRPLALVTLGEPSPRARQVIEAVKAAASGSRADIAAVCPAQVKPDMPRKAMQDGIEGVVKAQAVIRDGAVRDVTILAGHRVFHSAVREAMLQYKCTVQPGELVATQEFVFKAGGD